MGVISYPVLFNSSDLNWVTGLTVLATDPYRAPKRDLKLNNLARSDNAKLNSAFYNKRVIMVKVAISRLTRALCEQSIDALMVLLQPTEKDLVLPQSGITRRYTATYSDSVTTRDGGSYQEIELYFECSDRFGYDPSYTVQLNQAGITGPTRGDVFQWLGSAPTQAPYFSIVYTAITGGTSKTVSVGNGSTGQIITVAARTWSVGDRLEIDSLNKTVKVNGAEVTYSGAFPTFQSGAYVPWSYSDTLTTRTFTAWIYYYKRWA